MQGQDEAASSSERRSPRAELPIGGGQEKVGNYYLATFSNEPTENAQQ